MKIDFSKIDLTGFKKVPCTFAGVDCVLIYPDDITIKFNEQNKIFRSSIWTTDGYPVSLGYRKFVNYGEQPAFEPLDINDKNLSFPTKLDGSCLIVSKFNNELIIRTRQTIDARIANENGAEIDYLIKKYPKAFDNWYLDNGASCIYEWTTPSNIIVLRYSNEPELWLTGIIKHSDYSYSSQRTLDSAAKILGVNRGKNYYFNSFEEMKNTVEAFSDQEGVVIYSADGQTLKKIKSLKYLYLHKLKSKLNSIENLIEFFLANNCVDEESLTYVLLQNLDFEIINMIKDDGKKVVEAYNYARNIILDTIIFIEKIRPLPTRKEQAVKILEYDKTHSWLSFAFLDRKPVVNDMYKKLMLEKV